MASLKSGVLQKLYDHMKMEVDNSSDEDPKSVLLQIRSIIPVLEQGGLWPNRGFFLRVSDSTHALYVSLSEEQNEMILGNKLKLGQLIYAQRLEKADPVPLLRGVSPVPGRRPCKGTPVDIVQPGDLVKRLEASALDSVVEKSVITEKKFSKVPRKLLRGSSDSESTKQSVRPSKARRDRIKDVAKKRDDCEKNGISVDKDSEVESAQMPVRHVTKRRSWNQSDILSLVKQEVSLPPRSRSANTSPVRTFKCNSSDENSSSALKRVASSKKGLIKSSNESQVPVDKVNDMAQLSASSCSSVQEQKGAQLSDSSCSLVQEQKGAQLSSDSSCSSVQEQKGAQLTDSSCSLVQEQKGAQLSDSLCNLVQEQKGVEPGILWRSLPPELAKFGQEVIRQRDISLAAAVDALQEACISERLLKSLSMFSQFNLGGGDLEPYVDKFFELQVDLAHTRSIMQSLTTINAAGPTHEIESFTNNYVNEILERTKHADTWIRSAIARDLSPYPSAGPSPNPTATVKKPNPPIPCILEKNTRSNMDKGDPLTLTSDKEDDPSWPEKSNPPTPCILEKNTCSNMDKDDPLTLTSDKEDDPSWPDRPDWLEWYQGSTLPVAFDLAASLQDECKKLFLSNVDNYLDTVEQKITSTESTDAWAATTMYKVKMVSDCLDMIVNKDKKSPNPGEWSSETESETYERVRNKIYAILLKNVERTAMAFERSNATAT